MKLFLSFWARLFLLVILFGIFPTNLVRPEPPAKKSGLLHYKIDTQKSQFFVATGSAGVFSAFGHKHKIRIPEFSGEVSFDPADLSKTSLHVTIIANSLFVVADNQKEEKDKPKIEEAMREKVLEVSKFPDVDFRSTGVSANSVGPDEYDTEIHGDLVLHGVTRNITVKAKVSLGKDELTAKGEFPLKQTDYQIQPVSVAGGAVKVKDEIRLSFEMSAHP